MNINITVLTCLKLITVHKELPVKLLVQLIKDQASLGSYQCTVCIGIALVTDITDGLAFGVNIIHHVNEIQLVIPVIAVALGNCRIHPLQCTLHDVVHLLDLDLIFPKGIRMLLSKTADKILLLIGKSIKDTLC